METSSTLAPEAPASTRPKQSAWQPYLSNASVIVGGLMVLTFLLFLLVSLFWTPTDPNAISPGNRLLPAGTPGHLLGTDSLGRDVFSALLAGAKNSAIVAAAACLMSAIAGISLGLASASSGKVIDDVVMRSMDILVSIPGVVIALVLAATVGSGISSTIFALLFFFIPSFTRMARAAAMRVLAEDFTVAAALYGRGKVYIALRHVLPNISSMVIVQVTQYFAVGLLTEAGLSYLGVGINRPEISWGMMLKEAQQTVGIDSPLAIWPGLAIVFTVLGLNVLGDGLRDVLDPKLKRSDQ